NLWIVGDSGIIIYTTNSGVTWTKQTNSDKHTLYAIANVSGHGNVYAVGDSVILQAINYGISGYFKLATVHRFAFRGVAMYGTEAFIVGDSGYILHRDFIADALIADTVMNGGVNNFYDVAYANPF